jgi:hypothetical protein
MSDSVKRCYENLEREPIRQRHFSEPIALLKQVHHKVENGRVQVGT